MYDSLTPDSWCHSARAHSLDHHTAFPRHFGANCVGSKMRLLYIVQCTVYSVQPIAVF